MATRLGQVQPAEQRLGSGSRPRHDEARDYPSWEDIARASQLTRVMKLASVAELRRAFDDDRKRHRLMERLRWPDGFSCRRCREPGVPKRPRPDLLICRHCGAINSVTRGTLVYGAPGGLEDWFELLWGFADSTRSLDPQTLLNALDLASDEEAWHCHAELRAAAASAESARLRGVVEVDSRVLDLGHRRTIVLVAVERHCGRCRRTRLREVPNVGRKVMLRFVREVVEPGSTVRTDCWSGYAELPSGAYQHELVSSLAGGARAGLTGINRTTSLLRRWLRTRAPLERAAVGWHLDEFCLRFNHPGCPPGTLLCAMLQQLALGAAPTAHGRVRSQSGVQRIAGVEIEENRTSRTG